MNPQIHNIRLQYLQRYSLSKDGRVYYNEKEIKWYLLGQNIVCILRPSNCTYPRTYTLKELYLASWGTLPHASIVNRIRKEAWTDKVRPDEHFVLTDENKVRMEFGSPEYAARFLKTSVAALRRAVKYKKKIRGFVAKSY